MPANLDDAQEKFTCATFGRAHLMSVDAACAAILKEKCGGPDGGIKFSHNLGINQLPP